MNHLLRRQKLVVFLYCKVSRIIFILLFYFPMFYEIFVLSCLTKNTTYIIKFEWVKSFLCPIFSSSFETWVREDRIEYSCWIRVDSSSFHGSTILQNLILFCIIIIIVFYHPICYSIADVPFCNRVRFVLLATEWIFLSIHS